MAVWYGSAWLCRLTMPPGGGSVLDPFCGSGSTLIAAARVGRRAVGIEIDPAYADIARRRIAEDSQAEDCRSVKPYYDHSGITIYHGDAREILPTLAKESVDFIFTDPPYGHNNNDGDLAHRWEAALGIRANTEDDARPISNDGPEANELVRWFFGDARRLLMPGCCCCCCCCGGGGPDPQFARWSLWMDETIGFKQMIVWDKGGLGMGWHYRRNYETVLVGEKPGAACRWFGGNDVANVIRFPGIKPTAEQHPTPKPIPLPRHFIRLHTQPGHLVLDPFMGGGSTAVAAKELGRRFVGVELEERWCDLAARRLAQGVLEFPVTPTGEIEDQRVLF